MSDNKEWDSPSRSGIIFKKEAFRIGKERRGGAIYGKNKKEMNITINANTKI